MRFSYYDRLSAARKKIYRRSDEIVTLGIPLRLELGATVLRIGSALAADDRAAVQRACQSLIDALTEGYHVPAVRVRILAKRLLRIDRDMNADARTQFAVWIPEGDVGRFAKEVPEKLRRDFAGTMTLLKNPEFQKLLSIK